MKKALCFVLAMICMMTFAGCRNHSEPQWPNAKVPTVMYDGQLYSATSEKAPMIIDERDYLGTVNSAVDIGQWPQIDGQTNHAPYVDAPFAMVDDKLVLLVEGEWLFCELREVTH